MSAARLDVAEFLPRARRERTIDPMPQLEPVAALPILFASLLGSGHCIGMCGGFTALYAQGNGRHWRAHSLYNAGRLITYLTLGAAAAATGASLDAAGGIARLSALIVGAALVISGAAQLIGGNVRVFSPLPAAAGRLLGRVTRVMMTSPAGVRPLLIGIVTTWLPCGWLYTFVALSLAAADPWNAAGIMLLFWIGTLPALTAAAFAARSAAVRLQPWLPRVTGLLVVLSGLLALMAHLGRAPLGPCH